MPHLDDQNVGRQRLTITGLVQGVGFRPFLWRLARQHALVGWVRNDGGQVVCEIQGSEADRSAFLNQLRPSAPPLAEIADVQVQPTATQQESEFQIHESCGESSFLPAVIPADLATCDQCLAELRSPNDRRYGYPFINCTNCGPRFTIIRSLPYDRSATSMDAFPMCVACQAEYQDPADRRFHAQPNACPDCGPTIWYSNSHETQLVDSDTIGAAALQATLDAIGQGQIVAVMGLGGFHLVCDATNSDAVSELKRRKRRGDKPLAVMVRNLQVAQSLVELSTAAWQFLQSPQRPIVLAHKRVATNRALSPDVAPDNPLLGVMLPYSPLHTLLTDYANPLIMTSGNVADEPIVYSLEEAQRLANLADSFLFHNRQILNVCDDSVIRVDQHHAFPLRRSRGYAPMPIRLPKPLPVGTNAGNQLRSRLAVGGEIKATACLTKDNFAYVTQHIGDMGNLETLRAMQQSVHRLESLTQQSPQQIVVDQHPDYLSSTWGREEATKRGLNSKEVFHHHAHLGSLMAEHQWAPDQPLLGIVMDGTGWGDDRRIWGGEVFLYQSRELKRVAHLRYWQLPGGDAAIKTPARVALSLLHQLGIPWTETLPCVAATPTGHRSLLRQQLDRRLNTIETSSMGRLFDAVASLLGIRHQVDFEAQAACLLEFLAQEALQNHWLPPSKNFTVNRDSSGSWMIDYHDFIQHLVQQIHAPECVIDRCWQAKWALAFHQAVANVIGDIAEQIQREHGVGSVGLTGGVFQNLLLLRLTQQQLATRGFQVLCHRLVPPNDGGLSLGQAYLASLS